MIGSLMYLTASKPDIMFDVCTCARFQVTPKVSHLHAVKRIFRYLKGQPKLGLWYPKDSPFDLEAYTDSDYAGASLDRKSTTGGCQFLRSRLISWQCKKQTIVANSTTEAEYVAAASCCGQVLWIQNQMLDYGYNFMNTKIFINNESTICIVKNPVFHSKTKHIEIRHHFIRDSNEKKLIQMIKIHTDQNVADLLTKAFDTQNPRKAKRTTEISQSSGSIPLIADETVIKEWEDRMERAATTASSLEAEQDNGNINRTQSMATLNESFPQGTGSGSGPRRHLKLEDSDGISNLPTTKIFEQLALMGRLTRHESMVPQPGSPTQTNVADDVASIGVDVRLGGATTTVTSLEAGHGSGNIDKTPTMPHDSPLLRVHTLRSDVDRMQHNELMDLVTKLSDRVVQGRHEHDMEPNFEFTALEEVYTTEKGVSTAEPVSTAGASVSTTSFSPKTRLKLMKKKGRGLLGYKKKQALSILKNGRTFKLELKLMKNLLRD
ncbi:hypothetical protein Tco_0517946 [Tanacetum coccineum]